MVQKGGGNMPSELKPLGKPRKELLAEMVKDLKAMSNEVVMAILAKYEREGLFE